MLRVIPVKYFFCLVLIDFPLTTHLLNKHRLIPVNILLLEWRL